VRAVVPDDQLSLAIGKSAQNVRLAGQLSGLEIQLVSQSQQASLEGPREGKVLELEDLTKELGPKLVERLIRAGKETLQDVLATPVEDLMEIPGIGEKTASKLVTIGARLLEMWNKERQARSGAAAEAGEAVSLDELAVEESLETEPPTEGEAQEIAPPPEGEAQDEAAGPQTPQEPAEPGQA
jgi:transcription termination/antitermination protein NusA